MFQLRLMPMMLVIAAMVAAYAWLAWSLGVRLFFRNLAISVAGAVPLTVAAVILYVLARVALPSTSASSGGVGFVAYGLDLVVLVLAIVVLIEMLALRVVPVKAALWTLAAITVAEAGFILSALYYYRPTVER